MRWLLVDKVLEMEAGKRATGVRCFSRAEEFFFDHFPGHPIVPGVLQIEMIAQLGGKCIMAASPKYLSVLTAVKSAQFRRAIEPGDSALIHVEVTMRKSYALAHGWIEVSGKKAAVAEVMFGQVPIPDDKAAIAARHTSTGGGI